MRNRKNHFQRRDFPAAAQTLRKNQKEHRKSKQSEQPSVRGHKSERSLPVLLRPEQEQALPVRQRPEQEQALPVLLRPEPEQAPSVRLRPEPERAPGVSGVCRGVSERRVRGPQAQQKPSASNSPP